VSTRLVKNSKKNKSHLQSSVRYHRQIIDAMKAKDKALACRLMKEHVLEALDVLLSMSDLQEENAEEKRPAATVRRLAGFI
jgi:DNA-binding GntR family transcriptional regulator